MNNKYDGHIQGCLKCSNYEELLRAIRDGEWFRTDSMTWYYISVPYIERYGNVKPDDVACLRTHAVTSISTKYTKFYKLVKDPNGCMIYAKEDLEDLICKDLTKFAKNMSSKTLRIGTISYEAYLRAIPREIFLKNGLDKRMLSALKKGFVTRMKSSSSASEIEEIMKLAEKSIEELKSNLNSKQSDQKALEKNAKNSFDQERQKRINQLNDLFDKDGKDKD